MKDRLRSFPLFRVAGELLVIVAGILIALGADAWWESRVDSRLERTYLEAFEADLEQTIAANDSSLASQERAHQRMLALAESIDGGEALPDTVLRMFPPIYILRESMDTYRDLVASGGTTRITNIEVRRAMSRVMQHVEYGQLAEDWALDMVTSVRASHVASPTPTDRARLSEVVAIYLDVGRRVRFIKGELSTVAAEALAVVQGDLEDQ